MVGDFVDSHGERELPPGDSRVWRLARLAASRRGKAGPRDPSSGRGSLAHAVARRIALQRKESSSWGRLELLPRSQRPPESLLLGPAAAAAPRSRPDAGSVAERRGSSHHAALTVDAGSGVAPPSSLTPSPHGSHPWSRASGRYSPATAAEADLDVTAGYGRGGSGTLGGSSGLLQGGRPSAGRGVGDGGGGALPGIEAFVGVGSEAHRVETAIRAEPGSLGPLGARPGGSRSAPPARGASRGGCGSGRASPAEATEETLAGTSHWRARGILRSASAVAPRGGDGLDSGLIERAESLGGRRRRRQLHWDPMVTHQSPSGRVWREPAPFLPHHVDHPPEHVATPASRQRAYALPLASPHRVRRGDNGRSRASRARGARGAARGGRGAERRPPRPAAASESRVPPPPPSYSSSAAPTVTVIAPTSASGAGAEGFGEGPAWADDDFWEGLRAAKAAFPHLHERVDAPTPPRPRPMEQARAASPPGAEAFSAGDDAPPPGSRYRPLPARLGDSASAPSLPPLAPRQGRGALPSVRRPTSPWTELKGDGAAAAGATGAAEAATGSRPPGRFGPQSSSVHASSAATPDAQRVRSSGFVGDGERAPGPSRDTAPAPSVGYWRQRERGEARLLPRPTTTAGNPLRSHRARAEDRQRTRSRHGRAESRGKRRPGGETDGTGAASGRQPTPGSRSRRQGRRPESRNMSAHDPAHPLAQPVRRSGSRAGRGSPPRASPQCSRREQRGSRAQAGAAAARRSSPGTGGYPSHVVDMLEAERLAEEQRTARERAARNQMSRACGCAPPSVPCPARAHSPRPQCRCCRCGIAARSWQEAAARFARERSESQQRVSALLGHSRS